MIFVAIPVKVAFGKLHFLGGAYRECPCQEVLVATAFFGFGLSIRLFFLVSHFINQFVDRIGIDGLYEFWHEIVHCWVVCLMSLTLFQSIHK